MARGFNRIAQWLGVYDEKKYETLDKIGQFCKSKMDEYAAVDTGYMKSRNEYKVTKYFKQKLELKNDCGYSGYIEFGTYKMVAQPFVRPSVFNHLSEIRAIARSVMNDL